MPSAIASYILCASHKPPRCREKGVPRGCVAEGVCVRVARGARLSFRRSRAAKWGCAEGARVQRKTVCRSVLWWLPERTTPTRRFFLPGEGRWTRVIRTRACYVRHEMRVRPSCTDLLSVRSPTDTRTHTRAVHASACVQCLRVVCACSACGQCMGVGHACSACGQCMGAGHACTACVQCMRAVHACSACVQCMGVGCWACV